MTKEGDKKILTARKDWTKEQKEANAKNRKAVTVLLSSLSIEECCRVQRMCGRLSKIIMKALHK